MFEPLCVGLKESHETPAKLPTEISLQKTGKLAIFKQMPLKLGDAKPGCFQTGVSPNRGVSHFFREWSWLCRRPFPDCSLQVLLTGRGRGNKNSPKSSCRSAGRKFCLEKVDIQDSWVRSDQGMVGRLKLGKQGPLQAKIDPNGLGVQNISLPMAHLILKSATGTKRFYRTLQRFDRTPAKVPSNPKRFLSIEPAFGPRKESIEP